MQRGDLVEFRYFKNNYKNNNNLGVVLDIQTDLLIPKGYAAGFDYIDLMRVRWMDENNCVIVPYYRLGFGGQRWYLRKRFYTIS